MGYLNIDNAYKFIKEVYLQESKELFEKLSNGAEDQLLKYNTIEKTVEEAINIVRRNYT